MRQYLDIREINGYSIQHTPFHISKEFEDKGLSPINCLVYIGLPDNPQFLGPQDPQALAEHIAKSRGPSGENRVRKLSVTMGDSLTDIPHLRTIYMSLTRH